MVNQKGSNCRESAKMANYDMIGGYAHGLVTLGNIVYGAFGFYEIPELVFSGKQGRILSQLGQTDAFLLSCKKSV